MQLNRFCYCGSIRTGSFIVGITELIFAALFLIVNFGRIVESNYSIEFISAENVIIAIFHAKYFYFGYAIVSVITYVASIYGTNKKKRVLLLPYLILNGIFVSLLVSVLLISIGFTAVSWIHIPKQNIIFIICALTISLICSVIKIYFWMTIYSYYKEITTGKHFRTVYRSDVSNENSDKYNLNDQRLII